MADPRGRGRGIRQGNGRYEHKSSDPTQLGLSGGDDVVEAVAPDLAVQPLHDACGVVLGALDEQRLALVPETDHAGSLPFAEMPGARLEVRMWLEAEAASVLGGPGHQVLCPLEGRSNPRIGVGAAA